MIGLDTNILLRAATDDDETHSPIARRILRSLNADSPGYVNLLVLVEFAWTLDRRYRYSGNQIRHAIEELLVSTSVQVAERDAVSRALVRAQEFTLDFPDALICELNLGAGCNSTVTFDRNAARSPGFSPAS